MMSPHLEAWINKELSALASRIGSPLIMDAMTTSICNQGTGSLGYARVLVEVNVDKGSEENIDIFYKNKGNGEQFMKQVRVEYDWKPPLCSHCKVFGHFNSKCSKLKPKEHAHERTKVSEGFINVGKRKEQNDKKEDAIAGENMNKEDTYENIALKEKTKENKEDDVTNADTDIELDENDMYIDRSGTAKFMTINEVSRKDRKELWKEFNLNNRVIRNLAWVIMGDVNVSLNLEDHSEDDKRYDNCDVADQFVKHFEGFLGISPEVTKLIEDDNVLFKKRISINEANLMIREITDVEIKKALFEIDDNKAPGPDGLTSKFYKKSWDIVKSDFCAAIKEFFSSGKLLREVNATLISLVPKSL
ncbi:RNA-directed DNA polymerase, eukaryota, reverse transcriptase zinc-binding domain protein, partial [Tanacetum coccineum]